MRLQKATPMLSFLVLPIVLFIFLTLFTFSAYAADTTPWQPNDFTYTIRCTDTASSVTGSGCRLLAYDTNTNTNTRTCGPYQIIDYGLYVENASYTDTASCPQGQECEFSVCWYWTDQVYNTEPPQSHIYGVDKKAPWNDKYVYAPPLQSPGNDRWEKSNFTVQVTVHDGGSGVAKCEYRVYTSNTGKDTGWIDSGQCTGDPTIGADTDRDQTFTFKVTVGPSGMCDEEGRDTCHIGVRITDAVGNVNDTYEETVSIDYTPPRCQVIRVNDSSPYVFYNTTENRIYYNNRWNSDSFDITLFVNDSNPRATGGIVSGVKRITWPTTVSQGITKLNLLTPPSNPPAEVTSEYTYSFDTADTYDDDLNSQPTTFEVEDEAGNVNTCTIGIDRDVTPPAKNTLIWTAHRIVPKGFTGPVDFRLTVGTDEDNVGSGAGLQNVGVYVQRARGEEDVNHFPTCSDAWDGSYTTSYFLHNTTDTRETRFTYTDPNPIIGADIYREGYCHRYVLRVWDKVQNYVDINASDMLAAGGEVNITGVDAYDTQKVDACRVFGEMDNCNNRASFFAGKFTSQPQEQGDCPGSCIAGWTKRVNESLSLEPYPGATLYLVGKGVDSLTGMSLDMEKTYKNVSGAYGRFVIANITVYGQEDSDGVYGLHSLSAIPRSQDRSQYADVILPNLKIYGTRGDPYAQKDPTAYPTGSRLLDTLDVTFGFRADKCTPDCTIQSGEVELCQSSCNDAVNAPSCATSLTDAFTNKRIPDPVAVMSVCNGRPKGSIVSYNSTHEVICCIGPVIPKSSYTPVNLNITAKRIVTKERLVYYRGRLVKLVIKLFSNREESR